MRNWDLKTRIVYLLSACLIAFLVYLFVRVRMASGVPVVHSLWNFELASLLRTTAKSAQLLGVIVAVSMLGTVWKKLKTPEPQVHVEFLKTSVLCAVSFLAPHITSHAIPVLFGINF